MKRFERYRPPRVDYSLKLGERTVVWSMHEAENDQFDEIGLIVPGIMAKRSLYDPYAREMAQRGMSVATLAHQGASVLCPSEVSAVATELAQNYQKPVHLIGHSLGAIHATIAADQNPDEISGLLLHQPTGYTGVYPSYAATSLLDRPDNSHIIDEIRAIKDGIDYVRSSRIDHLLRTVILASRHDVIEVGANLPDHIQKNALLAPDDKLVRSEKCKVGLARAGFAWLDLDLAAWHNAQGWTGEYYRAGHNVLLYYPEALADETISLLKGSALAESTHSSILVG